MRAHDRRAIDAAPSQFERMLEPSLAVAPWRDALILLILAPSPSMNALTAVAILFPTKTPAPLTLTLCTAAGECATAPATIYRIDCVCGRGRLVA